MPKLSVWAGAVRHERRAVSGSLAVASSPTVADDVELSEFLKPVVPLPKFALTVAGMFLAACFGLVAMLPHARYRL
jgi:hypothetical protein